MRREYPLPPLNKTLIYLDTSIVSNISRARRPAFVRLHEALRDASRRNVIACVVSSIAVAEIELARDGDRILEVARQLGTARVAHELQVQDAQIWRAFGRFRRNEAPYRELSPPREDIFEDDVNTWPGNLLFQSHFRPRPGEIKQRRDQKAQSTDVLVRFYSKYADQNVPFDEIASRETHGFCVRAGSELSLTRRMEYALEYHDGFSKEAASQAVRKFFASDHSKLLPAAVINGRLHAALALAFRSAKPRLPEQGDAYDIEHLSTFLPYVDVFATDQFMAAVANQGNVGLAKEYGTAVQGLGERQVDSFIQFLTELTMRDSVAELSAAIYDAVAAGEFLRDLVSTARAMYPPTA